MKLKNNYFFTLREDVKDEDSVSSNLLVRAGFIKKSSSGVYMMLPLGLRVLNRINAIIRDEMEKADSQELLMPALIPEEVYIASGRRSGFGNSMFTLKDRKGMPYSLGPTHEELFAIAAKMQIRSYKNMPFSIYQIETKYRDEPRPRYGLIRTREFQMKDAYTFDADEAGMDESYQKQFNAYKNVMERLHLNYKIVRADTGVMGGLLSEEFQAIAPIGEDILVLCDTCDLSSNIEVAACVPEKPEPEAEMENLELVYTPNSRTIEEVTDFLKKTPKKFVKTLIYNVDGEAVAVMVRGDRDVNETKLRKVLGASDVSLAEPEMVVAATGAQIGFAGPINIKCKLIGDEEVRYMQNFIVGANQTGYHYTGVNQKDFEPALWADLRNIAEGDTCPICGGKITFAHGIEIGNTFKLGTKYSKALDLKYLDKNNQLQYVWMGSYGIGPARAMAALVEQNADENGINWPKDLAPFQCSVVIVSMKDEQQVEVAEKLYAELKAAGVDVLLDNRDERPGVKFKDMELIGIPFRVTVGRGVKEGKVEVKPRIGDSVEVTIEEAVAKVKELLAE